MKAHLASPDDELQKRGYSLSQPQKPPKSHIERAQDPFEVYL